MPRRSRSDLGCSERFRDWQRETWKAAAGQEGDPLKKRKKRRVTRSKKEKRRVTRSRKEKKKRRVTHPVLIDCKFMFIGRI